MRGTFGELLLLSANLATQVTAAAAVAGGMYLADRLVHVPWYAWVAALPVLYVFWLIIYLRLGSIAISRVGKKHSKPRYVVYRPGQPLPAEKRGLIVALLSYGRLSFLIELPLARLLGSSVTFRGLFIRAYSPSFHVGEGTSIVGTLLDPDITYIGEDCMIGNGAEVTAHGQTVRPGGEHVFYSAPIRIGNRVTIGGHARVRLGCVIGDDAVLTAGSALEPFTTIAPGEVWDGNPARFVRMRDGEENSEMGADRPAASGSRQDAASNRPRQSHPQVQAPVVAAPEAGATAIPSGSLEEIRELVVQALQLPSDTSAEQLDSQFLAQWDSLSQVAIAAALQERYGVRVSPDRLYHVRSLADIAGVAKEGQPRQTAAPAPRVTPGREAPAPRRQPPSALPRDREMLALMDPHEATQALAASIDGEPEDCRKLKLDVAATFDVRPMANLLALWGRAFGLELECRFGGFDFSAQTLPDPAALDAAKEGGVSLLLARVEDFGSSPEAARSHADRVLSALERYCSGAPPNQQILAGTLPPAATSSSGMDRGELESLRKHWKTRLESISGVQPFDFPEMAEHDAPAKAGPDSPYSPQRYERLAIAVVRAILSRRRSPVTVIVVECDNMLWGKSAGAAGLDGVQLGPDGAGRTFQLIQEALLDLKRRGVLLAVVSRNEERDVKEIFEKHPGMVLREEDIAAWRVNWRQKSENILQVAAHLNVGLDSLVLLDDDPAARLEVGISLPEVHVVPLPANPAAYRNTLKRLWLFDGAGAAETAGQSRAATAQQEIPKQRVLPSPDTLAEYLSGLGLRVEMRPPSAGEWARVAQLTQSTDQFNLNLRGRTVDEIKTACADRPVWVLRAADRFGDYGLIGVCVLDAVVPKGEASVDTLLMSCREMGRGVEDAFLYGVAAGAARRGAARLVAQYTPGPRNQMVRDFLLSKGFAEAQAGRWELPLSQLPPMPPHISFVHEDAHQETSAAGH